jgi:cytochrome P450
MSQTLTEERSPAAVPPGPPRYLPWGHLIPLASNPLPFITRTAQRYGDVVRYTLGRQPAFLLNDPDLIREVLISQDEKFTKGRVLQETKRLLGEGLLTSEGEFHRRQRLLIQPVFTPRHLATFADGMVECAARQREEWRPGATVDLAEEMRRLSMAVVGRTLFGAEVEDTAQGVGQALENAMKLVSLLWYPYAYLLERLPLPPIKRFYADKEWLYGLIRRMIQDRRDHPSERKDLLTLLLQARDTEGGMSDEQIRGEAITLFLAGHETMATALTWTFYLLSQNPDAEAALHRELDEVLGNRLPTYDDRERLIYTEWVFAESMRALPPVWAIGRAAKEEVELGRYRFPADSLVVMSQWVTHHDPRYYPDPLRFDPRRWHPEEKAKRPRFSYFPFGGGPRHCIGEGFAWMEGVLLLATLAQKWKFRLVPGHRVKMQPLITLRAKYGMRMTVEARSKGEYH